MDYIYWSLVLRLQPQGQCLMDLYPHQEDGLDSKLLLMISNLRFSDLNRTAFNLKTIFSKIKAANRFCASIRQET